MGNVLVDYVPLNFVTERTKDSAEIYFLTKEIFLSSEWRELDLGAIELDQAARRILERIPDHLQDHAYHLIYHWHEYMTSSEPMGEIIRALKLKGYKLYILSNAPLTFSIFKQKVEAVNYFDHVIVSAFIKKAKPDPDFFYHVLDTYDLDPKECFFVDDLFKNVEAALSLGIDSYLYNGNPTKLKDFFSRVGIL
jgi:putative hydrolase of the HAD superfamily